MTKLSPLPQLQRDYAAQAKVWKIRSHCLPSWNLLSAPLEQVHTQFSDSGKSALHSIHLARQEIALAKLTERAL